MNGQFLDHVVDFRHAISVRVIRTYKTTIACVADQISSGALEDR